MRLVTRSDFDGLVCAVLLVEAGVVDSYKFVHPKDLQDGLVEIDLNDVLANVPFVPGCGMWFDHHSSERERLKLLEVHRYAGCSMIVPSCARVIYDFFGGAAKFAKFDDNGMMAAVDRCDSGQLTIQEVLNPESWVLLSFIMDPRTGLGHYKDYRISNYQLMLDMIQYCRNRDADQILQLPDVKERVRRYHQQDASYTEMIRTNSTTQGNVLVINLLEVETMQVGNRFKEYAMYPDQDISLRIIWGLDRKKVVFTCGHSIIRRTSTVNVGDLMLQYGGGGHTRVGTCQVPVDQWETVRDELIEALQGSAVTI